MNAINQLLKEVSGKLPRAKPKNNSGAKMMKSCKYARLASLFKNQGHKHKRSTYYILQDSKRFKHYVLDESGIVHLDFNLHPLMSTNELLTQVENRRQNKEIRKSIEKT